MFTITNKLRSTVALGAVGVALAGSGAASAAPVLHPGTAATVAVSPVATDQVVDPNKVGGSLGVPGSTDADCVALGNDINTLTAAGYAETLSGDSALGTAELNQADDEYQQLTNNCIVID